MKPVDFSLETFDEIKSRLDLIRAQAHRAWLAHGPGTTREVSARSGMDILSLRPRSTELYQLGLLELIGRDRHNGIYRARTIEQWEQYVAAQRIPANPQLSLPV